MKKTTRIAALIAAAVIAGTTAAPAYAVSDASRAVTAKTDSSKQNEESYVTPMTSDKTAKRYKDFIAAKPQVKTDYSQWGEDMITWSEVKDAVLYYIYKKSGTGYTLAAKTVNTFYYTASSYGVPTLGSGTFYVRAVTYTEKDKKVMSKASDPITFSGVSYYDDYYEYEDYGEDDYEDYDVTSTAGLAVEDGDYEYEDYEADEEDYYEEEPEPAPEDEEYSSYEIDTFKNAADTPLSTFSADVDTASYANARRLVNDGYTIPADAVRTEEFLNYFDYKYKQPTKGNFSVTYEYTDCPWNKNAKIVMMGIQAKDVAKEPNSNLVFLIDVSGSMDSVDKLPLVADSLKKLSQTLTNKDRLSIVTYSGNENAVISGAYGNMKNCITDIADALMADGSTNGEKGLQMAYGIAADNFIKDGNNRVIMATDGDLNVGISDKTELSEFISKKRDTGVYLTVLGFGTGNLKDDRMEALAKDGNGNYHYIDSVTEAQKVLVDERKSTLITVADDVKLQVEFNPAVVEKYRLIGYEGRRLKNEDFANDAKDAADMGAGQSITVMYEIIPANAKSKNSLKYQTSNGNKTEICTLSIRYKTPGKTKSNLSKTTVKASSYCKYADTGVRFRFAACVAETAMYLRGDTAYGNVSLKNAKQRLSKLTDEELSQIGYSDDFVEFLDKVPEK